MKLRTLVPAALLSLALVGCSTVPYPEPPPGPTVATVHGAFHAIDGCSVGGLVTLPGTYRVRPGRRWFYMSGGNSQFRVAMDVRPGQSYDIDSGFTGIVTLRNNATKNEIYYDPSNVVYFDKSKAPIAGTSVDQPPSP